MVMLGGRLHRIILIPTVSLARPRGRIFQRPRVLPYRQFSAHERIDWRPGDFQSAADVHAAVEGCEVSSILSRLRSQGFQR